MRRFLFPLLFLAGCLFFPLVLGALPHPHHHPDIDMILPGDRIEVAEGRGLVVRSNPSGARVFIDGIERGKTPLRLENIISGRHFVRLEREGYVDRLFRVTVRTGSVVDVSLRMREAVGRVLLRIQPAPGSPPQTVLPLNPRIVVDGHPHLLPTLELPVGFRDVSVRAFGWEDIYKTIYVKEDAFMEVELNMRPASFRLFGGSLNRSHFNPSNAAALGTTTLTFEASARGTGNLEVMNRDGEVVFARQLAPFENRALSVMWNGRNSQGEILPDGLYVLIINGTSIPWDDSPPVEESLAHTVWLDSSRVIYPLTLSSGKSGLLFAPFPSLLPAGSFQIEGSLLTGHPVDLSSEAGGPWTSLPFSTAFRFSPVQRLELIAALNVIPRFEGEAAAGVSGGLKWALSPSNGAGLPFRAAAGLVVSRTGENALTPFGMASGVELFLPLGVDMGRHFSFALTPAALWTWDQDFLREPAPMLLVSGGLMMRMTYLSAGLSVRSEYDFNSNDPAIIAGGEIKFFPPPSSFVVSLMGGVWVRNGNTGGFGGIGIGMIY